MARDSASNEGQIRAIRQAQSLEAEQLAADFAAVLGSRAGRHVLWSLLEDAGMYGSTFHENQAWAAFREGQRNVGLQILATINEVDPTAYVTMIQEHQKKPAEPRPEKGTEDA